MGSSPFLQEEHNVKEGRILFSVFTKSWRDKPLLSLGEFVRDLGFDGLELPVRPGFQVEPQNASRDLPRAAELFAKMGLRILSVAAPSGPPDEALIAACAQAKVPILRVMAHLAPGESYVAAERRYQQEYDRLLPLLKKHGVTLGIQNHCDRCVANAVGLRALIGKYDPQYIAAIWDAAHEAVNGNEPELALDIIWPHLCMVNLKNLTWQQVNGPEAEIAEWQHRNTSGRYGLASWPRVIAELRRRNHSGIVCLTAEYAADASPDRLIAEDIALAKSLFDSMASA